MMIPSSSTECFAVARGKAHYNTTSALQPLWYTIVTITAPTDSITIDAGNAFVLKSRRDNSHAKLILLLEDIAWYTLSSN